MFLSAPAAAPAAPVPAAAPEDSTEDETEDETEDANTDVADADTDAGLAVLLEDQIRDVRDQILEVKEVVLADNAKLFNAVQDHTRVLAAKQQKVRLCC